MLAFLEVTHFMNAIKKGSEMAEHLGMKISTIQYFALCAFSAACTVNSSEPSSGFESSSDPAAEQSSALTDSAGSSVRNGVGPTIYSKNFAYTLTLPQSGGAGVITSVRWTWSLSYNPPGLLVALCRNTTASCISLSTATGVTPTWNGLPSNVPFLLTFTVNGTGTMSPAYGQNDQVIVNYQ
ncbi:MAG: flagellar protein FlhE [Polyangiaceae bacterium]